MNGKQLNTIYFRIGSIQIYETNQRFILNSKTISNKQIRFPQHQNWPDICIRQSIRSYYVFAHFPASFSFWFLFLLKYYSFPLVTNCIKKCTTNDTRCKTKLLTGTVIEQNYLCLFKNNRIKCYINGRECCWSIKTFRGPVTNINMK